MKVFEIECNACYTVFTVEGDEIEVPEWCPFCRAELEHDRVHDMTD